MSGRQRFASPDARSITAYDARMTASALNAQHRAFEPAVSAGMSPRAIDQLLAFYDEPHRSYHSRVHVQEMLDASLADGARLSAAQVLAVLAHDAVYVPGAPRGSNETLSAQLLKVYARSVAAAVVDAAAAIIHDTIDHQPRHAESPTVLDLDLMRLGAEPAAFERYSREVFFEQRPLITLADDDAAWHWFDQRRAQFFETMLARPQIYRQPQMRAAYEQRCRQNLSAVVARVKSAETPVQAR
jgi:predicted metal-dependent HD superfamily phosphohydrolase